MDVGYSLPIDDYVGHRFGKLKTSLHFLYCFLCLHRFNWHIYCCVVVISWFIEIVKTFIHLRHDTSRFYAFSSSFPFSICFCLVIHLNFLC